jgi:hypothetical protein
MSTNEIGKIIDNTNDAGGSNACRSKLLHTSDRLPENLRYSGILSNATSRILPSECGSVATSLERSKSMRKCIYCNEPMTFGIQHEVMYSVRNITEGKKSKTIEYEQLGWRCNMQDDNCDIVFDDNNTGINEIIYNLANEKMRNQQYEKKEVIKISDVLWGK